VKRIFLLEDEIYKDHGYNVPPRTCLMAILGSHNLTIATSSEEAKTKFTLRSPYDYLILDYDMNGVPGTDLANPNTGLNFVQWLVKFPIVGDPTVFLHSQNAKGRGAMRKLLVSSGYGNVSEHYYGNEYVSLLKKVFK
jgi:hypothetical protein